jgi:hypothetical protein
MVLSISNQCKLAHVAQPVQALSNIKTLQAYGGVMTGYRELNKVNNGMTCQTISHHLYISKPPCYH